MALEAQTRRQICLTQQRCLRRGTEREPPIYEYRATVDRPIPRIRPYDGLTEEAGRSHVGGSFNLTSCKG